MSTAPPRSERAWIGLGANLGDPVAALAQAADAIAAWPGTGGAQRSSLYRTAPVDASGPDFVNAVMAVDTTLSAQALLAALQAIEQRHHRQRPYRNAPRTLDLDLLLYGTQVIDEPALQVPHPRMHLRAFVLCPLLELWPDAVVPGRGRADALAAGVAGQAIEQLDLQW